MEGERTEGTAVQVISSIAENGKQLYIHWLLMEEQMVSSLDDLLAAVTKAKHKHLL